MPGVNISPPLLTFRTVSWEQVDWGELDRYPDRTLFQSRDWLTFLQRTQGGEPRVIALTRGAETVSYLTCLVSSWCGVRIVGSPFPGWTTRYMGFNTRDERVRDDALRQMGAFVFKDLGCWHFEVMDRQVDIERARSLGLPFDRAPTYEVELTGSEPEILGRMHASVRRYIRRAESRHNLVIEECRGPGFAEDYYTQLQEVFAKDSLVPSYGIDRVRALMDCLLPSGDLLLLRARDRSGRCIATGVFPARHGTMYFWGGASLRASLAEHPNEPLQWYAMRYWKRRGVTRYDMGGGGEYKARFGGQLKEMAWIRQSRSRWIAGARDLAFRLFSLGQRFQGWHYARANR